MSMTSKARRDRKASIRKKNGKRLFNDSVKALRVIHRALTPEQIAARGGLL